MAGFRYRDAVPVDITMIPHPLVTLLFDLSERGVAYDVLGHPVTGNAIVGLRSGAFRLTSVGPGEVLQIRMSPVVAAATLRDTDVLGGAVTPLPDLWGSGAALLTERLRSTPSWDERFALAAAFLRSRVPHGFGIAPEIAYAWDRAVRTRGRVRIETLAAETGWSRQRLWSRFRALLGVSPKHASELVRFDHAAHLLAAGRPPADAAVAAGYADQSHLHRRTKAMTAMTPAVVARAPWLAIDEVAWPAT
ncbi:AraC family transcriptional regulator [Nocardia cyriacigeorgica]|uniref:AraC family transcriptional regulator n=2 Tax=Nocardia cyriacigeorgica TaxID=135487 RepID=A0A6P1D7W9_9NOCA|nr:AraC family transcriptional regulator [Nocardia cyriacigeorgica]NEW46785.1 AraC family transcriptional regulator [Nocardia cyriacigeorgica]NEW50552.1 AraC family transcriptional regulator [Nocardia cyriacigeorgica]NEW57704.1 AraC family transcriptional regulator [Nocardia cyriacigeorgica]